MNFFSKNLASIALLTMLAAVLPVNVNAATPITLKSALADKANILAFHNAVNDARYADLLDRPKALTQVDVLKTVVKADIADFAARLKANNEVAAFNSNVLNQAAKFGGKILVNEILAQGGPYVMLLKAGASLDLEVNQLKAQLSFASLLPSMTQLLGISNAYAGILSTACGGFWFVISWGYADRFAYTSCYQ